jgi:hypothetical protein
MAGSKLSRVVEDIRQDCDCEKSNYCPLEMLLGNNLTKRMLEQHKCVEKFKYILSYKNGSDIGWENAYQSWVDKGYAQRFSEIYSDDKKFRQIWKDMDIKND